MTRPSLTTIICAGTIVAYLLGCAGLASAEKPVSTVERMAWSITYPGNMTCTLTSGQVMERDGYRIESQTVSCEASGVNVLSSYVACDSSGSVSRFLSGEVVVRCMASRK